MRTDSDLNRRVIGTASPRPSRFNGGHSNAIAGIALGAAVGAALWFGIGLILQTIFG